MFRTVLVANRGEIACRVIRTLRDLGITSVAVYSDADAAAKHVREADIAVRIGPAAAGESYLNIDNVIAAAKATGAEAIHPGYGFLSENVEFARRLEAAGIIFIGPPAAAVEVMGDKIRAKIAVSGAGVPVVPGRTEPDMSDTDLIDSASEIGYPVLIKPSAGGGGKGMHLVTDPAQLAEAISTARREAASSFGDDTLFIERFVTRPRHIEVQVLADNHGNVIHLGERECSLQRRHQKIIEEAPSPLLDEATRQRIGQAAVETARSVNYSGAGTVEFIVSADAPDEFFFMEMNTRLQVEHPVTEMVTGIDLVEQQLLAAAGVRLGIAQSEVTMTGHAIEARVYAENPARGFLPTGGTVLHLVEPSGDHVRVDSSLQSGSDVGTTYDPMLAKVIAWGADRSQALSRLDRALGADCILGVQTNLRFLRSLINFPAVIAGELDTEMVGREIDSLIDTDVPETAYIGYIYSKWSGIGSDGGPWDSTTGWRSGRPAAPLRWKCKNPNGEIVDLMLQVGPEHLTARIGANDPIEITMSPVGEQVLIGIDGIGSTATVACAGEVTWVHVGGVITALTDVAPERAAAEESSSGGEVRSPMPGTIIAVHVQPGAEVSKGNPLVVVEAMKMEHSLVAPIDGITSDFNLAPGQQVAVDQLLLTVAPATAAIEEN